MPEPTRNRPSRNYEFLFLFTKQPDYYFDRTKIDVPARASQQEGVRLPMRGLSGRQATRLSQTRTTTKKAFGE